MNNKRFSWGADNPLLQFCANFKRKNTPTKFRLRGTSNTNLQALLPFHQATRIFMQILPSFVPHRSVFIFRKQAATPPTHKNETGP